VSARQVSGAAISREDEAFVERLALAHMLHPGNLSARFVNHELIERLTPRQREMLRHSCQSGASELDSDIGCYLLRPGDLRELGAFFGPLIRDYHHAPAAATHVSGWNLSAAESQAMDLSAIGLPPASMRVRVARNLEMFSLPASMDRAERVRFERWMSRSLQALIDHPEYGGRIYSLTPEFGPGESNPNLIGQDEYQDLLAARVMFRNMDGDRFMKSAGIAADWPYGRACYVSRDREVIVWIGEEDHLRIICMKTGTRLNHVFERLRDVVALIQSLPGMTFVRDPQFGYVTSCPSNLGSAMRASVHVRLPRLMNSGVDVKEMCAHFGLTVCGPGGERTPIRENGILELSPMRRAFVRERDIVKKLYDGVRQLSMLSLALILVILSSPTLGAQGQPGACTSNCVAIRSTGGFLGYLDGFPEFPGWIGDTFEGNADLIANPATYPNPSKPVPYGGLIGATTFLASHTMPKGTETVLLVSGNNHPQQIAALRNPSLRNDQNAIAPAASHWFWKSMIALRPQAVAVGTEDMHRWLAQMRPEHLSTWIKDGISAGLPLVASNVIIRLTDARLNVITNDEHDVTLDVVETGSLDLLDSVTVLHPCATGPSLRSSGFRFDDGPAVTVKQLTPAQERYERESASNRRRRAVLGDVCRTTLVFEQRLRPGRSYLLSSSLTGPSFRFRLTTHQVLTPHAAFGGLPVAGVTPAGVPMAIMSFISPTTASELPPEYFEWRREQGCAAAICRIEFLDAPSAARTLLAVMTPASGQPSPILLAISDLPSGETNALLDGVPEIRFISLRPDSGRLGRAAAAIAPGESGQRRSSGDQSFGAVVDQSQAELTRFLVRPTWLGETVVTAIAAWAAPTRGGLWRANDVSLGFQPVPGASLGWTTSTKGVQYNAFLDPRRFRVSPPPVPADPTMFQPYCPVDMAGAFDAVTKERQDDLWTNAASFAGLVLDDMRRSMRADVALVPAEWIDRDVIGTIAEPPDTGVPPMSGFMLQRVLFRSNRVVRVAIEGSVLSGLLAKIVADAAAVDDAMCVSGLGVVNSCPLQRLDTGDLLVNVRRPEEGHYYRVVMPASIARAEGLAFNEASTRDLLVDLDGRLANCSTTSTASLRPGDEPLAERLESRLAGRVQHYVKFDPLTFDFSSTRVNEPAGSEGVLSKLPVDSSGARPSRMIAFHGEADAVLLDTGRNTLSVPAELRYRQRRVGQEVSYDEDEFSIGLRFDRHRFPARWARVFAGVYWDGRLFDRDDDEDSDGTVVFAAAPVRNLAAAYGLEVPEQSFGSLTVTGLQFSHYHFTDGPMQSRIQIDARTRTRLSLPVVRSAVLSTEHRYRWYRHDDEEAGLFTERSGDTKVSLDVGIGKRWTVGPYVEHTGVLVGANGGPKQYFTVFNWGLQVKVPLFWNGRSIE
jgi:hypothetical protein